MAVNDILDKIVERYPDVIGAIAKHEDRVFHNLQAPYDIVCAESIMQTFTEMFDLADALVDEGFAFDELILDFDSHSFIIRVIDNGLLVILTPQLQRAQLVKLQVGLGLFTKSVAKALAEEPAPAVVEAMPEPEPEPEQIDAVEPVETEEETQATGLQGKLGFVGKRLGRALTGATKDVMAVDVDAVKKSAETSKDEVPIGPDGKPKKARMYRGVVFYD